MRAHTEFVAFTGVLFMSMVCEGGYFAGHGEKASGVHLAWWSGASYVNEYEYCERPAKSRRMEDDFMFSGIRK